MYSKAEFLTGDSEYINQINQFIYEWFNEKDFIISKTSGSTGTPKEIKLRKSFLRASARMTGNYFNFKESDSLLLSLPIFGIGGKMIVIRAIEFNTKLIVVSPQNNPLSLVQHLKIKIASFVPYQINKIIEKDKTLFDNIENILIGGAPINLSTKNKLQTIKSNCFETFGMTETYSHIAIQNIKKKDDYFTVFDSINIETKDNCLFVKAPSLGIEGLKTNDLIELKNEKQFKWIGRADNVINSGGIKLHPEEIEKKLESVIDCPFFIGKELNSDFGEIIILIIESNKPIELDIIKKLKQILSSFEMPKKSYFIENFIYTNTQKINRIETLKKLTIER
jgi:O-succinylbenzoic acid--CoA ligase